MTHTIEATRMRAIARAGGSLSDNLPAPWEVFRPQQAVVELVWDERIRGYVLDVGCGTGENALFLAEHGLRVTGIDIAGGLVRRARQKATRRGTEVEFVVGDVLATPLPGRRFDTVIDSGLFHTLRPSERSRYATTLSEATREGGVLFMLCFSDSAPGYVGPACLGRAEIERVFGVGWRIESLEESRFELRQGFVPGWLACIRRTGQA